MQVDLSGLRALVTGSTKGIGRATALKLAQSGAEVAVNGRKGPDVTAAIAEFQKAAPEAKFIAAPGDVAKEDGAKSVIDAAGDVDILVNNVSIFEIKDAFEIPDGDWREMFEVNVLSGVRLTRHYGPKMKSKGFGRIVFISSESGIQIPTEMIHYGFSKAAQLALVRGFAQALSGSGVTVNAVLPGPTMTDGVEEFLKSQGMSPDDDRMEEKFFGTARPNSIIKRFEKPEEIAEVVAFVVSREAAIITGAPIRAEGGIVLSIT